MGSIPSDYMDLFEKKTIANVATLLPTGAPHVTPVWVDYDADADRIEVNTERGRRKEKNARNDPRVAISLTDPDYPYRMLTVRGEVDEITTEGAREHIDRLAKRYRGVEKYPNPIQTERVIISIEPKHVTHAEY